MKLLTKNALRLHSLNSTLASFSQAKDPANMKNFNRIMNYNKKWSEFVMESDPDYFNSLVGIQRPQYLWVGCADSRVPANQICGLKAGEVFVHRNIANLAPPSDINFLAVLQYAVEYLQIKDIIVAGHYGCGGIKAAFRKHDYGPLQAWLSHIRQLRWKFRKQLSLPTQEQNEDLLCELNVKQQVYNIARIPMIQSVWKSNRQLRIHGVCYNLGDGLLNNLGLTIDGVDQLAQQFIITN